jgi:hypothetical protein
MEICNHTVRLQWKFERLTNIHLASSPNLHSTILTHAKVPNSHTCTMPPNLKGETCLAKLLQVFEQIDDYCVSSHPLVADLILMLSNTLCGLSDRAGVPTWGDSSPQGDAKGWQGGC